MDLQTIHSAMMKRAAAKKKPATKSTTTFGYNIDNLKGTLSDVFIDNGPMRADYSEPHPIPPVKASMTEGPTPLAALNNTGRWNDYRPGEPDWRTVLLNGMRNGFKTKKDGEQFATDAAELEKKYLGSDWANWPISKPNTQKPNPKVKKTQTANAKEKAKKK